MVQSMSLGHDEYGRECNATLRQGMRSRNEVDMGGVHVWRVYQNVIITNEDGRAEYPLTYQTEAQATLEMARIVRDLEGLRRLGEREIGDKLPYILNVSANELPVELLSAWIS